MNPSEKISNSNEQNSHDPNKWDILSGYDASKDSLDDKLLEIDNAARFGTISPEKALEYRRKAEEAYENAKNTEAADASSGEEEKMAKLRTAVEIAMNGDSPIGDKEKIDDPAQRQLENDLLNIDDMLRSGRITEEKAEQYRKEVRERAYPTETPTSNSSLETRPETIDKGEVFARFQIASGASKEAEFKRLTGEDWPGENYYAETYGVDEGYDEPIENWTIYKRNASGQNSKSEASEAVDPSKDDETPEDGNTAENNEESDGIDIEYIVEPDEGDISEAAEALVKDTDAEVAEASDDGDKEATDSEETEENGNKVDLGEGTLKNIEDTIDEDKAERLKEVEDKIDKMLPELAELYAKNRRIIVGAKNRADFIRVRDEYAKLLDESLKLKSEATFNAGKSELSGKLQERVDELNQQIQTQLLEFVGGDPNNTTKTQEEVDAEKARLNEEAEKTLRAEYGDMIKELEANVNAEFLNNYLEEAAKLEDATIDALDNGTICRKFVNKVINNKVLKGALIAAAAAGLAFTGVGLATGIAAGTMSVGLSYTAGGVALGAGKGALMGGLMSRQNSKNSAVRGFVSEEEIKAQLESIDSQDADTSNVANWLLEQYSDAKDQDLSSNRKRTALSAGIGAALGGLMSGVQINNVDTHEVTDKVRVGTEPDKVEIDLYDNVDVARGGGMYDSFTQLGGNPDDLQQALDIAHNIDAKYSMVPGSNSITAGYNGQVGDFAHTYPGPISEWPDVAQSYMREVAEEWARQGLIPSHITPGGPIYDTITRTVTDYVPNAFMNFIARATATAGAGAIGGVIGGVGAERSRIEVDSPTQETEPTTPSPETPPQNAEPVTPPESVEPTSTEISGGAINDQLEAAKRIAEERGINNPSDTPESVEPTSTEISGGAINDQLEAAKRIAEERGINNPSDTPESVEPTSTEISGGAINDQLEAAKRIAEERGINPEEAEGNNATPETNTLAGFIAEEFGDRVGEEGVRIMTDETGINEENDLRINDWWDSLDEDTKRDVLQYELSLGNSTVGQALRVWLRENVAPEQR